MGSGRAVKLAGAALIAAAIGGVGCSALYDLDRTAAGDAAAGDAPDGGSPDAGGDAPRVDGFCARQARGPDLLLCDDFDEGALGDRWSSKTLDQPGATLEPRGRSAPNALLVDIVPSKTRGLRQFLMKDALPLSGATFAFAMQPVSYARGGSATFHAASVRQGQGGGSVALSLLVGPYTLMLQEQRITAAGEQTFRDASFTGSLAAGFRALEIDVAVTDGDKRAKLRVDGSELVTFALDPMWAAVATSFQLGSFWIESDTGYTVLYDDVVIRTR